MEEAEEDDMTCGDLGNGLGRRPGGVYEGGNLQSSHSVRSRKGSGRTCNSPLSAKGAEQSDAAALPAPKRNGFHDGSLKKPASSSTRQSSCESNTEVSNEELKQQLQEALEELEVLKVELEASQRQLEGKDEALRILQSMAVFDKATSHTKAMLQKSEEEKRTLEKEINILQWEIEFDQDRFKNLEDTWTEKYDRIYCENAALKEALKLRTEEVKTLKAENAILNQQCLEFLAMLDVKQQKVFQENMLNKSDITDFTGLEMENLKKGKDEAYITADAFRIAFEQQLMQRQEQALRLAEVMGVRKESRFGSWSRRRGAGSGAGCCGAGCRAGAPLPCQLHRGRAGVCPGRLLPPIVLLLGVFFGFLKFFFKLVPQESWGRGRKAKRKRIFGAFFSSQWGIERRV
ncbi:coiled-coil domain-containing protein 125 isoform X2 [Passer montanus]|uniref:coiled-coil domain-containing protein 125 isoform X2 n=1 Tax=Passer montanus TaxID=9160 RepID=UPI0019600397|nr:coiled-coil domain-containing protein 125 isoform X2 [Passer montanus]